MQKKYTRIASLLILIVVIGMTYVLSQRKESILETGFPDILKSSSATPRKTTSPDESNRDGTNRSNTANNFVASNTSKTSNNNPPTASTADYQPGSLLDNGPVDTSDIPLNRTNRVASFKQGDNSYPVYHYETQAVPNDPNAVQDWTNDINLQDVWDIGSGATETSIAVIDSGFSLDHQEFTDRWQENAAEQGVTVTENPSQLNCTDQSIPVDADCNLIDDDFDGTVDNESGVVGIENPSQLNCTDQSITLDKSCNLIDDDANGYTDDAVGWDFVNFDRSTEAGETNAVGDTTGHGTMVSGIAAATGNNGVGIAGVNWSSKILPLQAIDDDGYGNTLTVSRAIDYAVDQGVDVISLSLGSESYDAYLRSSVDAAIEAGIVVVAASGNDGCNCIRYPANFPEVIAVGAVDQAGDLASFSNTGADIDISAPGVGLDSATWALGSNSSYVSSVDGTSFSTPIVSGLLALLKSHQPDASWGELTGLVAQQASKAKMGASYRSQNYGFGSLDASSAVLRATESTSLAQATLLGPQLVEDSQGSSLIGTCPTGIRSSIPLYQLVKSGSYRYTVSELTRYSYTSEGWTSSLVGYACTNLPTDTIETYRALNLLTEIRNLSPKSGF